MNKFRKKLPTIIITVVGIAAIALIGWFCIYFYMSIAEEQNVRYYCIENSQEFDKISEYFKALNREGLKHAEFNADSGSITLEIDPADGSGVYSESIGCESEEFVSSLAALREKYQPENQYPVFSYVSADYDESGNMLLYLRAHTKPQGGAVRAFLLVYIDEDYSGGCPSLGVSAVTRDAFSKNWCFWTMNMDV